MSRRDATPTDPELCLRSREKLFFDLLQSLVCYCYEISPRIAVFAPRLQPITCKDREPMGNIWVKQDYARPIHNSEFEHILLLCLMNGILRPSLTKCTIWPIIFLAYVTNKDFESQVSTDHSFWIDKIVHPVDEVPPQINLIHIYFSARATSPSPVY